MFELFDTLVGAALAFGATNYFLKSGKKEEIVEKMNEIKKQINEVDSPTPKPVDNEVIHRLDALEDLFQNKQPMGVSTEHIAVKVLYITEGVRYHFHYLHRAQPFLTLTFHEAKQQVIREYVMEDLVQDKKRLKDIIKQLSDKILEENGKHATVLTQLEEQTDPVFKKAHVILMRIKDMETQLLPSEVESIQASVEKIISAYEPLKATTKKQCQDEVFAALGKLEDRLNAKEDGIEQEKIKRLQEEINEL